MGKTHGVAGRCFVSCGGLWRKRCSFWWLPTVCGSLRSPAPHGAHVGARARPRGWLPSEAGEDGNRHHILPPPLLCHSPNLL